jgi:hypothetical protein
MRLLQPIMARIKQLNGSMKKVELHISTLIKALENGLSWFKSDDQGFGSIQETYDATDFEITMIMKHPKLKDVEPNFLRFILVDDLQEESISLVKEKRQRKPKEFDVAQNITQSDMFQVEETSREELNAFIHI